jgi:hypothetical protein
MRVVLYVQFHWRERLQTFADGGGEVRVFHYRLFIHIHIRSAFGAIAAGIFSAVFRGVRRLQMAAQPY